ncbi:MAG: phosphoglycerate dehydrogenase [Pseudomonadota bacterium]
MPRVLIADKLSPRAAEIFAAQGIEVDVKVGLSKEELAEIIGDYHGLAVRSATKVTPKVLDQADNLKVVGRAGIGVDNIDVPAATAKGVVVMNTPFGNSITTAEHAISMMMALARQIPTANASTHAGKWEKSRFMGVELYGKTLGVFGCGNIGSIVANRAIGLQMKVIAYDPYLSVERATEIGVEKVELDDLLKRSDFLTLHTPLTKDTRGVINAEALAKMKAGARIINCARGGLIDEDALKVALDDGHIAGAALDVFAEEPATEHPLLGYDTVVCTPHLGASTMEAQENVAIQVAEQMADYLLNGAVVNALNMASVSAQDAPKLRPYLKLGDQLGSLAGQITESAIRSVTIEYCGHVAELNNKPITGAILAGLMRPSLETVNAVSAPVIARERNVRIIESQCDSAGDYLTLIRLTVETENRTRSTAGSLVGGELPRVIEIENIPMELELSPNMLFVRNEDQPGLIGGLGTVIGESKINIADFRLGRKSAGGDALALVSVDGPVPADVIERVNGLPNVVRVHALRF